MSTDPTPLAGTCSCGRVVYELTQEPLFVHCCHCRHCQRESGAAFAINALIETDAIRVMQGAPIEVDVPTNSGKGQIFLRCPDCQIALWSHYAGAGRQLAFVRVGTLKEPGQCRPDIHIFTESMQPWVSLPEDVPAVPRYYNSERYWPTESLDRVAKLR